MSPTKSDSSVEAQPRSGISLKEDEELPGTKTSSASSTDDSEESYPALYTTDEVLEFLTFLNYNTKWFCLATFCNIVLFSMVIFRHIFVHTESKTKYLEIYLPITMVCEAIILIDAIAEIVFILNRSGAQRRFVNQRNKILVIMDIISLTSLPLTLVSLTKYDKNYLFVVNCICLTFRNYRLPIFFYIASQLAGHNTLSYLAFKYGLLTFVLSHIFACILMSIRCIDPPNTDPALSDCNNSWTLKMKNMREYTDHTKTTALYYVWCIFYSLNTITSTGLLGASNANSKEQILSTVLMFFGIYLIHGLFLGAFTSVQIDGYRRHAVFSYKLELITSYLATESVSRKLKRKIKQFYIAFWKRNSALRRSALLDSFPRGIQDRVLLDKFWEALNASNVLRDTNDAFKRALADKMYAEIYTAGEIIYAQDKIKNMLMFVSQGSVQILSGDDTESTLLILGMRSCLGDISLIYSLENAVQVVSTSFSVIYCLKKADLWRTAHILKAMNPSEKIHQVVKSKIRMAKLRQDYKKQHQMNFENVIIANELDVHTANRRELGRSSSDFNMYIREEAISNLYVITKDADYSQHDGIFIRTTFPWILRPSSEFLFVWESFFVFLVSLVAVFYPWQTMNDSQVGKISYVFKCFVCLTYTVDYIIHICTAVEDDKGVYTKFSDMLANKCSQLVFVFDTTAFIPSEFITISRFMRLNRIFMIYRVVIYIRKIENSFKVNVAVVRCIKYVIYLLYISYCTAVIYYMSACDKDKCKEQTWAHYYKNSQSYANQTLIFETAMMYAMLLVSGTGGRVIYRRLLELTIVTTTCIIGLLVLSYLISDYSATLTLAGRTHYLYIEMVAVIRKFMQNTHMPQSIQNRMNHYLEAQWIHNKGLTINKLLRDAPQYLYEEYQVAKYGSILDSVPLFQELDEDVLVDIAAHCETVFFPPNEFVTYSREIVKEMYVVEKGFCEIISPASGRIEKVIGPRAMFSVIDMILELPGVFHVRTVTHVSLIKITLDTLKKALKTEDKAILHKLVEETKHSFSVQLSICIKYKKLS
ncbi:Cyclic nucleotide-binding domain [Popillia japonica]|uniref:Cyclic nucleotide-binding domain n=1 Tax=Popillia japonica TaxID=7064 RepID=A0AAW1N4U0_POPJA